MNFVRRHKKLLVWLLIAAMIAPMLIGIVSTAAYNGSHNISVNKHYYDIVVVEDVSSNSPDFSDYTPLFEVIDCKGVDKPSRSGHNGTITCYLIDSKLYFNAQADDGKHNKVFVVADNVEISSIVNYVCRGDAIMGLTQSDYEALCDSLDKAGVLSNIASFTSSATFGEFSLVMSMAENTFIKSVTGFITNLSATGFTTEAKLMTRQHNYVINSDGVVAAIQSMPESAEAGNITNFLTKLLGVYDQKFGKISVSSKTVNGKTFKILNGNSVLVSESAGVYPGLGIIDGKLVLFTGTVNNGEVLVDITNKVSATYKTIEGSGKSKYADVLDKLQKYSQNATDYDNADTASGALTDNFTEAYDYYAAKIVLAHINSKDKDLTSAKNEALTALNDFPEAAPVSGNNTLTPEEVLRLQAFNDILNCIESMDKVTSVNNLVWNNKSGLADIQVAGTSKWNAADLKEQSDALVNGRYSEYSEAASPTLDLEVTNCLAIAKYNAALAYGMLTDSNSTTDYTTIRQSDFIESVTLTKDNTDIKSMKLNFKDSSTNIYKGIPAMTKLGEIKGTTEARNAYYNLNLLLVAIADWCNDNAATFDGFINDLKGKSVEDVKNGNDSKAADALQKNITLVKAAVNINDTLEFLGVDKRWFPNITKVCGYANDLRQFADLVFNMDVSYEANEEEPMKSFFNISTGKFADDYLTGVALSATFKPMYTNMYDVSSVSFVEDSEWVTRFHYPWGFYRKALYIDTDTNAAINNYVTSKKKGSTRVATLKDLLEPEKDIVLYIDDNFYNIDKLADIRGEFYNKEQNTGNTVDASEDTGVLEAIGNGVKNWVNLDIESVVKSGGNTSYSKTIRDNVKHVNSSSDKLISAADSYILSLDDIDYQLKGYSDSTEDDYAKQYSALQPFAVVSAIYRDQSLFQIVDKLSSSNPPVFVSSPNLFAMSGIPTEEFNSIYNYAMLKNLNDVLPLDYKSQLDLTEPIYMDVYGNIITDSGLVVIPAMANATLCGSNYSPLTVGFIYLYNSGSYKIPGTAGNCSEMLCDSFSLDENSNNYMLRKKLINGVKVNLNTLQLNDEGIIKLIYESALDNCYKTDYLPFNNHVYMITEVLRGAPLEYVDKDKEMITTKTNYTKTGVWIANKLDEIINSFYANDGKIKILSLPNLAYMDGFEYVILYLYKIIFVALFVLLVYRLYTDAVCGSLGIKSVLSFIMSVVMFIVTAFAVPYVLDLSYYQVNKHMLQKETMQTIMLNEEKKAEGREIGLTGVQAVSDSSKFYLKVDDLTIPWYAILDDILLSNTSETLNDLYEQEMQNSELVNLPRFAREGQYLYIDVDDLLNNSTIIYNAESKTVTSYVTDTPYESYVTPYYVILDSLIGKIDNYNVQNQIDSFDPKVMSGGQVKTVGLIKPYLTSSEFMETSQDVVGFKKIYGMPTTLSEYQSIKDSDIDTMRMSYWYADPEDYSEEDFIDKIDKIDAEARQFVSEHRSLLGKISDESFLEVMALDIACKHNSVFKIGNASAIENYNIDATDVIRLSLAPKDKVISQCSKSFSRFVYDNAGTLGTIASAFLLFVYIISSVIKPICLAVIIFCLIASVIMRRIIKKNNASALEGYMITMGIMCVVNILFSLIFKLSMYLPKLGLSITASALVQIALQALYLVCIVQLTMVVVQDWKNAGFDKYYAAFERFTGGIKHAVINTSKNTIRSAKTRISSGVSHSDYDDDFGSDNRYYKQRNSKKINSSSVRLDRTSGSTMLESLKAKDEERSKHARRH